MSLQYPRPAIILVEPQTPQNIGAICRTMRNFGFSRLILVNPCDYLNNDCQTLALFAYPIAEQAEVYTSLEQALQEIVVSFGFTRRKGRLRPPDGPFHDVFQEFVLRQQNWLDTTAFVFGREDSGLSQEEAQQCSFLVELPTDPLHGSMNLAHAVTCACYEFQRTTMQEHCDASAQRVRSMDALNTAQSEPEQDTTRNPAQASPSPVNYASLLQARQQTYRSLVRLLDAADFYSVEPRDMIHQRIRSWLERSLLSEADLRSVSKFTEKMRRIHEREKAKE